MSSTRRRPPSMQPDNMPAGEQQPAAPPSSAVAPVVSDPASKLADLLAGSPNTDTSGGNGGASIPLSALVAPHTVDPDLDLIGHGVRLPRYLAQALDTVAFLGRRTRQQIVADALRAYLPAEVVAEARRRAAGGGSR